MRESQALLGDLDLYQVHSATLDSGVLEDRDVLAELASSATAGWWSACPRRAGPGGHDPPGP